MIIFFVLLFLTGCSYLEMASIGAGISAYGAYEYSKQLSIITRLQDLISEEKVRNKWEKMQIDEPCLEIVFLESTAIIVGGYSNKSCVQEAAGIAVMYAKDVHNISMPVIGKYNEKLVGEINTILLFSSVSVKNYFIYAIKDVVWVVGVASHEEEKQNIIKKIKDHPNVKSVETHIKIANKEYEKSTSDSDGYVLRF